MIYKSRIFDSAIKNIIDPVIQRNGYFAHPENILLAMIADERQHIRELALKRVLKFKVNSIPALNEIRIFKVPIINFDAKDYTELIDWQLPNLTVPPLLKNLSCENLKNMIGNIPEIVNILNFPATHKQLNGAFNTLPKLRLLYVEIMLEMVLYELGLLLDLLGATWTSSKI